MVNRLSIFAIAGLLLCAAAQAADQPVVADLVAAKVSVNETGRQKLQKPRNAKPGDIVEYRITYRNTATDDVQNVVGTLAIPANRLSYVPGSAVPSTVEVSVDGKTFTPASIQRLVVLDDGSMKMQPIPADEYRFLRWQLGELPARGSKTVSVRMRIAQPPEAIVRNSSR